MEILSVPVGKETAGVEPVLLFRASKMLTFSADPLGPELALPPQAVSPTSIAERQATVAKQSHLL